MVGATSHIRGPDFAAGVPLEQLPPGRVVGGHVGGEPVLVARLADGFHAVGGTCTHYGAHLADGLVVGETVRCPLHHACFSLRTGEALAAPAIEPLARWEAVVEGDRLFVRAPAERAAPPAPRPKRAEAPGRVVIVGGGAAGFAAAEMLRRRGFDGDLTMLSADPDPPCDRPNLSKDYLAGTAPEEWILLKGADFYAEHGVDLRLATPVAGIDPQADEVVTAAGERLGFDRLLLATGAEPVRLPTPGFERPQVHTLRSVADARAIIAGAQAARAAVVVGASFIGLEAAAALRTRGLAVHVVAPDAVPMARVLGAELGGLIRSLHEANGVVFHLGQIVERLDDEGLRLSGGETLAAELVVVGVGVRPRLDLAAAAGLVVDNGVVVDAAMRTSRPGVYAAGDIAAFPDPLGGGRIRVEHWVAAERQGQRAAAAMLGEAEPSHRPPFFWSNHYELSIRYVGHAGPDDALEVDGSIASGDATVRFLRDGRLVAAAAVGRDRESLQIEAQLEAAAAGGVGAVSVVI